MDSLLHSTEPFGQLCFHDEEGVGSDGEVGGLREVLEDMQQTVEREESDGVFVLSQYLNSKATDTPGASLPAACVTPGLPCEGKRMKELDKRRYRTRATVAVLAAAGTPATPSESQSKIDVFKSSGVHQVHVSPKPPRPKRKYVKKTPSVGELSEPLVQRARGRPSKEKEKVLGPVRRRSQKRVVQEAPDIVEVPVEVRDPRMFTPPRTRSHRQEASFSPRLYRRVRLFGAVQTPPALKDPPRLLVDTGSGVGSPTPTTMRTAPPVNEPEVCVVDGVDWNAVLGSPKNGSNAGPTGWWVAGDRVLTEAEKGVNPQAQGSWAIFGPSSDGASPLPGVQPNVRVSIRSEVEVIPRLEDSISDMLSDSLEEEFRAMDFEGQTIHCRLRVLLINLEWGGELIENPCRWAYGTLLDRCKGVVSGVVLVR